MDSEFARDVVEIQSFKKRWNPLTQKKRNPNVWIPL
jgi:hypothetical protein